MATRTGGGQRIKFESQGDVGQYIHIHTGPDLDMWKPLGSLQ